MFGDYGTHIPSMDEHHLFGFKLVDKLSWITDIKNLVCQEKILIMLITMYAVII